MEAFLNWFQQPVSLYTPLGVFSLFAAPLIAASFVLCCVLLGFVFSRLIFFIADSVFPALQSLWRSWREKRQEKRDERGYLR